MQITYNTLTATDTTKLKELNLLFGEVFEDMDTYNKTAPSDKYLKRLLQKDDFIALTAEDNNKVVGGLTAYVLEKFEQDRREIYIYDLGVKKEYRRQKVATNLINHLKQIAKDMDAYVIIVQTDYGDKPAIKLYESLGTKEEVLHFDISPQT